VVVRYRMEGPQSQTMGGEPSNVSCCLSNHIGDVATHAEPVPPPPQHPSGPRNIITHPKIKVLIVHTTRQLR
jgi:hypothetical protein